MKTISVMLEVAIPDGVAPATAAEAIFDWACHGGYEEEGVKLVDTIDSFDYKVLS
jgi:hypothetical protein